MGFQDEKVVAAGDGFSDCICVDLRSSDRNVMYPRVVTLVAVHPECVGKTFATRTVRESVIGFDPRVSLPH